MKRYKIRKGKKDWKPFDGIGLYWSMDSVEIRCRPNESLVFDYKHGGQIDPDWRDWKKIAGVSLVNLYNLQNFFDHSRDSIQLAYRYNPLVHAHEFSLYVNDGGDQKKYESPVQIVRVNAEDDAVVVMEIQRVRGWEYEVLLMKEGEDEERINKFQVRSRFRASWFSRSGLWYGGANNADGPFGGAAPKDMYIDYSFKKR